MRAVAIVTDDLDVERRLFEGFSNGGRAVFIRPCPELVRVDAATAAERLVATGAQVVVLAPPVSPITALTISVLLNRSDPNIGAIIVGEPDPDVWQLALDAGVAALPTDADADALRHALDHALVASERRGGTIDLRDDVVVGASKASDASPPARRLITVLAPKGGVGKTTIATNLAVGLGARAPESVALVDLDLQFGDVADMLGLDPERTIGDIRGRSAHLDSAELKLLLARHESDAFALCAPDEPTDGEEVEPDDVRAALGVLAADMSYVIVDTASGVNEAALIAIEMSTDLVLVASNDVPSLRNLRKLIVSLDRLGITEPTRHFVLNRAGTKVDIETGDVEDALGLPIDVRIPSSRAVTRSVNHATPILFADPRHAVSRSLAGLVARFADSGERARGLSLLRRGAR